MGLNLGTPQVLITHGKILIVSASIERRRDFSMRMYDVHISMLHTKRPLVLNSEELATIYHFLGASQRPDISYRIESRKENLHQIFLCNTNSQWSLTLKIAPTQRTKNNKKNRSHLRNSIVVYCITCSNNISFMGRSNRTTKRLFTKYIH